MREVGVRDLERSIIEEEEVVGCGCMGSKIVTLFVSLSSKFPFLIGFFVGVANSSLALNPEFKLSSTGGDTSSSQTRMSVPMSPNIV